MEFDELSNRMIGCAIEVHRYLGPGLLESTYEPCLAHEPSRNGTCFQLQLTSCSDFFVLFVSFVVKYGVKQKAQNRTSVLGRTSKASHLG